MIRRALLCLVTVAATGTAYGYEVGTHITLSQRAVAISDLGTSAGLVDSLGISFVDKFPNSARESQAITELIQFGAGHEDRILFDLRSLNHFFDVQHDGRGLSVPLLPTGEPSPVWILDGRGQLSGDEFSNRTAREHFLQALTVPAKTDREIAWGRTFQTLGHVIHHVQDMAQPEHVRNDAHPNLFGEGWYERYTNSNLGRSKWSPLLGQAGDPVFFVTARSYWTNSQNTGMADFTSRNFVSKDTIFNYNDGDPVTNPFFSMPEAPDLSDPSIKTTKTLQELGVANADALCDRLRNDPTIQAPPGTKCEIEFIALPINNVPAANQRAVSLSVFDQYLQDFGEKITRTVPGGTTYTEVDRLFTLNRFNFDSGYPFLIPRAVSYSAGLINHFFRGRMELESAEVENGQIRIEIKNTSETGNAFGPGTFTMYYDSYDGTRKPLAIDDGADLGAGQFAPGGTHVLLVAPPEDLDLKQLKPFTLVYEGAIGQEKGVAGFVFGAEVRPGLLVNSDTLPSDGVSGPRLIYKLNGQWKLHPQGGFAGGNIDWKGQYVNGIPKKVLSWRGYLRYFGPDSFNFEIYQGGRLFSVAPGPVLGAAIRLDTTGREWLVAISRSGAGDIVYTRPNTYNLSSALFDPATAPEGWREIAFFPKSSETLVADRAWHFNGDGTEAQTMRRLVPPADSPSNLHSLTRLKITVSEQSASMTDMGNTFVKSKTTGTKTESRCGGSGYGTLEQNSRTVTSGESIIAVDYLDSTEILAKFKVNDEEGGSDSGSLVYDFDSIHLTSSSSASRNRTLQIGSLEIQLEKSKVDYQLTADETSLARTITVSKAYPWQFALDLRTASVGYALSVENTTEERIADGYTGSDRLDKNVSIDVQLHHKGASNSLYNGVVETRSVSTPINRRFDEFEFLGCDKNGTTDLSREIQFTSDIAEWTSQRSVEDYSAGGTLAIDRESDLLASYFVVKRYDLSVPVRGAFLTDGNIFTILGIPDSSRIYFTAPN